MAESFIKKYSMFIIGVLVAALLLNMGTEGSWDMGDFDWDNIIPPLATVPPAADDDEDPLPPPPPPPADDPDPEPEADPPPSGDGDGVTPYFGYDNCNDAAEALDKEYYFATPGDLESCYEWGFNYCVERGWWLSNYDWAPPNCCVFNCGGD